MKRIGVLLGFAAVAVWGAMYLGPYLSFEALAANRAALVAFRDAHLGLSVLIFVLGYGALVALSLPGASLATLTGGFLYGVLPGAAYNVAGASLGAVAVFMAVRWGLGAQMAARLDGAEGAVARVKAGLDQNQWSMLFLMRLMPVVPFFVANLLPAFLGVPLRRFAISTVLGIIPGAVVYTAVGAGLGQTLDRGEAPNLGVIFEPHILLPLLGLCLLAALPMLRPRKEPK